MVTAEEKGIQSITGDGLMDSVMVNYDALDWTLGFCRKLRYGFQCRVLSRSFRTFG
jgi:hypothetical protein